MKNITILGLGAMGSRVAQQFIKAGYYVHVWNRSPAAAHALAKHGARAHDTPRQAAEQSRVVIAMVRDDLASKAVWLTRETGAMYGLQKDSIAIESSTLSPDWVTELNAQISGVAHFLEAPVVGSRPQAESGELIYLLGGDPDVASSISDVLNIPGSQQLYCGGIGKAATIKLTVNAFFATQTVALGELFSSLAHSGISPTKAAELFAQLPTTSPAAKGISQLIAAQIYDPLFPVELVLKDLHYQNSVDTQATLPLTQLTEQRFQQAIEAGLGHENIHAVAKLT